MGANYCTTVPLDDNDYKYSKLNLTVGRDGDYCIDLSFIYVRIMKFLFYSTYDAGE